MWAALTNTLPYWFLSKCFVCDRPSRTDSNANTVYIESIPLALFSSSCPVFRYLTVPILYNSYSTVVGIYGSKPTEPEGAARGQGRFTVAINP